ncbi:hypothetical protein HHK36_023445 [Tetracentron sinense]|uniref:Uncharacterized protein n=1 Tax=Tetracentron sinense TaxID=13715 RepID=A0A835D8P7_TETSI|nr:hypothetical protein HHK36_023445 [Tetracentron sinense]
MEIQEWFKVLMKEKKKFWQEPGDLERFGRAFVLSEEQEIDWGDLFFIISGSPTYFPSSLCLLSNYTLSLSSSLYLASLHVSRSSGSNVFDGELEKQSPVKLL